MANVDWMIKGPELTTCNCAWGCPCQFNSLPTNGNCRAAVGMRIDQGHFAKTKLDGLHWVVLVAWPKAIHLGNGEALPIVDERADAAQREALLKIISGQETEPGATMFNVFAGTFKTVHEPLFKPIEFTSNIAEGFEYHEAEYASSATRAQGKIALDWKSGHAHLTTLHLTGPAH